ncbi:methyltransferase domain-containing protein [Mycolicibacterium sp. CBMA 226]|uniref:methyltransferase domain-containing protein n=1 Tax=Mycolicibacterium sp. CBMA 226 TaxID=2606611 RepID=UPI0012DF72B1|nr:methyltransferase domain-containing protein [Mycolicibacterium sp. CBMA 226]MUL80167.1 methyltransferase domain-containing protein [Mycolicibacterium sp. CBMA 226]
MTHRHYGNYAPPHPIPPALPRADRSDYTVAGHWLLARLGKRVLRPGGVRLTRALLADAGVSNADVVELAPGLGRTAAEILARSPRSYLGVELDPDAADIVALVAGQGNVTVGDAAHTGLPDGSADVVIGESLLTMHDGDVKEAIVAEAVRLLRPGGRYAVHELAMAPDTVAEAADIAGELAGAALTKARPMTVGDWQQLLTAAGLTVERVRTRRASPLALRRQLADEGIWGTIRFAVQLAMHPAARSRVRQLRASYARHRRHLAAVALLASKPAGA